jgi:4-amino-4-deoxy-L-arabinose transferase-like glycosyltransferase
MKKKFAGWIDALYLPGPGLFVLELILRLPVLLLVIADPDRATPPGDAPGYFLLAANLFHHGVFSQSAAAPFLPDAFRTPGYPGFLWLILVPTGFSKVAVAAVQSILHALTGLLLARLGGKAFGSRRIGFGAAVLWSLAPLPAVFAGMLLSEILFTFVFVLFLWILLHPTPVRAGIGGAVLGLGILIRPIAVVVAPAALPALWAGSNIRQALAKSALLGVALLAIVGPWVYRNAAVFGKPSLAAVQGYNLLEYNAAGYVSVRDGISLADARRIVDAEYQLYLQNENIRPATMAEESDAMTAAALRILAADPVRSVLFNGWTSLNIFRPGVSYFIMFLDPGGLTPMDLAEGELSPAASHLDRPAILLATILLTAFYGGLYLLAGAGLLRLIRNRNWRLLAWFGLPCLLLFYAPGIANNARFRIPLEPVLCLLAAVGLGALIEWGKTVRARRFEKDRPAQGA